MALPAVFPIEITRPHIGSLDGKTRHFFKEGDVLQVPTDLSRELADYYMNIEKIARVKREQTPVIPEQTRERIARKLSKRDAGKLPGFDNRDGGYSPENREEDQ